MTEIVLAIVAALCVILSYTMMVFHCGYSEGIKWAEKSLDDLIKDLNKDTQP